MSEIKESVITKSHLQKAISYAVYRKMIDDLMAEGKTTGENHSENMIHYTKMNLQRMNRVEKTVELSDETVEALKGIDIKMVWVVLTEAWCGDAAQNIPVLAKIADASDNIELMLLLRDENLDVMDEYLTNGGRSIPKLVALDAGSMDERFVWGPRPEPAQEMMNDFKANPDGRTKQDLVIDIQKWYAKDRGVTMQKELVDLMKG